MTDSVYRCLDALVAYGLDCGLYEAEDEICIRNCLLEELKLTSYSPPGADGGDKACALPLEGILEALGAYAAGAGLTADSQASILKFQTALMGRMTPKPSEVIREFRHRYARSPEAATDYFYKFCQDANYISRYRTARDVAWTADTDYGALEITINLSKPEKDPLDIARAAEMPAGAEYPLCLLCVENEGYAGGGDRPPRQNHRIIPIKVAGEDWGLQYSPYVYYNEHCILLNHLHTPMIIDEAAFRKLLSFEAQFPHYFIGSNADLPIVGGSILAHEHFQGGRHSFPMEKAPPERYFSIRGFQDVEACTLKWPMPVLRAAHADPERLAAAAAFILDQWRGYNDESSFIYAYTGGTPHNTVTAIARFRGGRFELDLVLRNNITTPAHPLGVYHPHEELHHIKKENIGLIEVMGLAVLPARLLREMEALKEAFFSGRDLYTAPETAKHADWFYGFGDKEKLTADNIDGALRREIGKAFALVLEQAGVFKRGRQGMEALSRFLACLGPR